MKFRVPVLSIVLIASSFAADDEAIVRFSNGDQLTGEVLALSDDMLSWKSQILKEPAEFELSKIVDLSMPAGSKGEELKAGGHKAVLEMKSGDKIEGRLAGLTDNEIKLHTSFAGELRIRRVNVLSIKISRTAESLYSGPNSIEEWTAVPDNGSWQFRGGALQAKSPGGIAREMEFPDECGISFDASWRGSFGAKIVIFSNNINSLSPDVGYEMVFQGNSIHVKKCGTNNNWLGHSAGGGMLRENEKAHIEIKASKKTGKILLYIDGKLIDLWQDADFAGTKFGKGLHFISQNKTPLRISNLNVGAWDGTHEEAPNRQLGFQGARIFRGGFQIDEEDSEENAPVENLPEGRMILLNGDSIEGEVQKIEGEDITLKTPFREVTFPIARLKNILVLKKADLETPKRYKGDVRATFSDGSHLVFRFEGVEDGKIIGFSQQFGQARFPKDTFRRIEFNIYDETMDSVRNLDDW